MTQEQITKRVRLLLSNLPYGGIKTISERSGFPRSTVIDVLSNHRTNRRIDQRIIFRETAAYLKERKISYEPLKTLF